MTPAQKPPPTPSDARSTLARSEMRVLGLLPHASNYTFLAELGSDSGEPVLAVYKPQEGEAPLWDFPEGTLHRREAAASVLARHLGWPSVPPTVVRDGPFGPGSVQLFIPHDPSEHFFTLREGRLEDFRQVAVFDVVANNADRKGGHCLLGEDGRIWAIDHGVCFAVVSKLRTVIWDFAGQPVPEALRVDLERSCGDVRSGDLGAELQELLAPEEVAAIARRIERLVDAGTLPFPGSRRAYPWPPI